MNCTAVPLGLPYTIPTHCLSSSSTTRIITLWLKPPLVLAHIAMEKMIFDLLLFNTALVDVPMNVPL